MTDAERQRGARLHAPVPGLWIRTNPAAARQLGRDAEVHPIVGGDQSVVGACPVGQRGVVLQAGGAVAGGALERPPIVALVLGGRVILDEAAAHHELAVEIAVSLQRPGQHLAAAQVLGIERQVPLQHARAPSQSLLRRCASA